MTFQGILQWRLKISLQDILPTLELPPLQMPFPPHPRRLLTRFPFTFIHSSVVNLIIKCVHVIKVQKSSYQLELLKTRLLPLVKTIMRPNLLQRGHSLLGFPSDSMGGMNFGDPGGLGGLTRDPGGLGGLTKMGGFGGSVGVPSTQESDPHQHLFPTSRLQQSPSVVPPLGSVSGHKLDYPAPSYSSSHTLMGYSPLGLSQPVASPHLPSSFPSPQPPGGGGGQQQQGSSVVTKQEQFPNSGKLNTPNQLLDFWGKRSKNLNLRWWGPKPAVNIRLHGFHRRAEPVNLKGSRDPQPGKS